MTESKKYHPQTELVHGGSLRSQFGETSEALYLTSGYVYDSPQQAEARFKGEDPGFVYSRYANPTVAMFEQRMILLEGAEAARGTASGMAAVNAALLCQLRTGDHVVSARALFGSCLYIIENVLPNYGIEVSLIDGNDLNAWKAAMQSNTKVCFLESPTNPMLDCIDILAVCDIAHNHNKNIRVVIDNVFSSPVLQKPLPLGADIVVYSGTKHIDGQGRVLAGIVLGKEDFIEDELAPFHKHTGPSLSPFNAWVMLKGLETLDLRVNRMCDNAAEIADIIAGHKALKRVLYPGRADHPHHDIAARQMTRGGTLLAFELTGGKEAAFRVLNALELVKISNNLGDAKSLVTHPSTTTHQRLEEDQRLELGITQGLIRFSAGLEDVRDLIEDMTQALDQA